MDINKLKEMINQGMNLSMKFTFSDGSVSTGKALKVSMGWLNYYDDDAGREYRVPIEDVHDISAFSTLDLSDEEAFADTENDLQLTFID